MKYIIYFISILIFMASPASWAQDTRYRVELLVLMHLGHAETAEEAPWVKDYSGALDLLLEPEEEEPPCPDPLSEAEPHQEPGAETASADTPAAAEAPVPGSELPGEEEAAEIPPDPNAVFRVEEMGPEMQEAWRRLRLSGAFRPLQYLSWEQGNQAPFPELRVHGEDVAYIDDPYAELRAALLEAAAEAEAEAAIDAETNAGTGPLEECTPKPVDPFPAPTEYFVLDGRAMLERSRFLHLDLDLQLREAVYDMTADEPPSRTALSATEPPAEILADAQDGAFVAPPRPSGFAVHGLAQRRQVRSGRMEYFDGPVIGVLAWITAIELADAEER